MNFGEQRYRDPVQAQQYFESSRWAFGYPLFIINASLDEFHNTPDISLFFRQLLLRNLENYNSNAHQRFLIERAIAGEGYMFHSRNNI
jgi:hypothetical protein